MKYMKIKFIPSINLNKILIIIFFTSFISLTNLSLKSQPNLKINLKDKTQKEILAKELKKISFETIPILIEPKITINFKDKSQKDILANDFKKITFQEIELPKPTIKVSDYDFETYDIKEVEFKKVKIKVENLSKEVDLKITNFDISDTINFSSNINQIINSKPFIINKGQFIEIDFEFTPKSIGIKESRVRFISNADNGDEFIDLKGEAIDTVITSINDLQIGETNNVSDFIYTLPPYPNPTQNEVITKIYFNNSIGNDLNLQESLIGVYDLNGNKVSNIDNLNLEILTVNTANIKWNCSGVQSGAYFIKIQNGNKSKFIKVIVN